MNFLSSNKNDISDIFKIELDVSFYKDFPMRWAKASGLSTNETNFTKVCTVWKLYAADPRWPYRNLQLVANLFQFVHTSCMCTILPFLLFKKYTYTFFNSEIHDEKRSIFSKIFYSDLNYWLQHSFRKQRIRSSN